MQKQTEKGGWDGRMASGDNRVGHWASHGCHRSPDWLSDGFNTAAKPFNTGVSYCVCVFVWMSVCVKMSTICAICSPCLCHQNWYPSDFLRRLIRAPYSCTDKHTHHNFSSQWDKTWRSACKCACVLRVTFSDVCTLWGESVTKCYTGPQPLLFCRLTLIGQQDEEHTSLPAAHSTPLLFLNAKTQYVCACVCQY